MPDDDKKVIIYDTGRIYWCYESDIYDPPECRPREKSKPYNEENETIESR